MILVHLQAALGAHRSEGVLDGHLTLEEAASVPIDVFKRNVVLV